jgi:hypothetical protein
VIPAAPKDDFTSLFNGKDLTGWKVYPSGTGSWKVEDGAIVGSGKMSHLFSERGDYKDFHFRVECMINDRGNSGQYFRTKFEGGVPRGWEAQINATHSDPIKTGSLHPHNKPDLGRMEELFVRAAPHKPNEWFTQEVICQGPKITILVNGKKTVEWTDPRDRFKEGHFALQQLDPGTVVKFRKIEVKELPPPGSEGFVSLFNGKDLSGWKVLGGNIAWWGAKDGVLFFTGNGRGWLMTEKEYADFELRLEFKVSRGGNSGVALRSPFEGDPAYTGMEIQILDDAHPDYRTIKNWQRTGSIYGVMGPTRVPTRPLGQWNRYRIVCKGRELTIELNGEKVLGAHLDDSRKNAGDGKPHLGLLRENGHIGLQGHDRRTEFRNLNIKEIPPGNR